ncbi:MAG: hypothetical protein FWG02_09280 [Holophagaceae bacterium]|nr:hypothetical protein [Holophagaceae bacterium]
MKFAHLLILPISMVLSTTLIGQQGTATTNTANRALQESEEIRALRLAFSDVLDTVNKSWFGEPYQQIRAVDLNGNLAILFSETALDEKITQLSQGAIRSPGVKSGQAFCALTGTYFANGDHLYNVSGDLGMMRFQRIGEKGFWFIRDQNVYTTSIDLAPPDAPLSFMGWFASVMTDIKTVYVDGPTFKVSEGKVTTIKGKEAKTVVFNAPTAPYDPLMREQAASDTFGFWKKGHLEASYDPDSKQPLRMAFSNVAQGIEASMDFDYNASGRIRQVTINNKSKQWEGPGFVRASYDADGMISAISGELTGKIYKIAFNLSTTWNKDKGSTSLQSIVPPIAQKLGREDMELRIAMMFASNIGELQRMGFNFMTPKLVVAPPVAPTPQTEQTQR